jgi:hypothetical protein
VADDAYISSEKGMSGAQWRLLIGSSQLISLQFAWTEISLKVSSKSPEFLRRSSKEAAVSIIMALAGARMAEFGPAKYQRPVSDVRSTVFSGRVT